MTDGAFLEGGVAALSLAAVVFAILLAARLARHFRLAMPAAPGAGPALHGTLPLDARRRLHLVECQGRQALVLTGGATDVVVCLPPGP